MDHLDVSSAELVTLVIGGGVPAAERGHAHDLVRQAAADGAEVEVIDGGQRPARYVVGVE